MKKQIINLITLNILLRLLITVNSGSIWRM